MARWRVTWGGSRGAGRGRRSGEEGEEGGGAGAGRRRGGGPGGGSQPRCFLSARGGGEPRAHPPCLSPPARSERLTIGFKSEDEERILRGGGVVAGECSPEPCLKERKGDPAPPLLPCQPTLRLLGRGKLEAEAASSPSSRPEGRKARARPWEQGRPS